MLLLFKIRDRNPELSETGWVGIVTTSLSYRLDRRLRNHIGYGKIGFTDTKINDLNTL